MTTKKATFIELIYAAIVLNATIALLFLGIYVLSGSGAIIEKSRQIINDRGFVAPPQKRLL